MTRIEPDPVFAAAARTELERRARRGVRPAERRPWRPARPDVMQLVVAAAVGLLILGVVLGVDHLRKQFAAAPPPTVQTSAAVQRDPAPRPTSSPTASPTRTSASASASAAALIVPQGFQRRSDAQLRAWAATLPRNAAVDQSVWIEQQILIVHCMAGEGFLFDPEYRYSHGSDVPPSGHEQAYAEALDGPASSGPYSWRTAGCTGLAVHQTGQDDAH